MYSDPIAFFITWTCYGTWLPGDERGWTKWHKGEQICQPLLKTWCAEKMTGHPILLNPQQRCVVNQTITEHCDLRSWKLHAVNCRTNHCHCVVTADNTDGETVRDQLKSWCTRRLNANLFAIEPQKLSSPIKWWTKNGSVRYLFDEESLEAAIKYVLEAQDVGGSNFDLY